MAVEENQGLSEGLNDCRLWLVRKKYKGGGLIGREERDLEELQALAEQSAKLAVDPERLEELQAKYEEIKERSVNRSYHSIAVENAKAWRVLKCRILHGEDQATLSQILAIVLPADNTPVISELANEKGFAVEAVVPSNLAAKLVFALHEAKVTAIVVQDIEHFVP